MPVSNPEREAYFELKSIAEAHGCTAHLSSKLTEIADPKTVPRHLYDWATRAHVDVLIRRDDRMMTPLLAVEVDGLHHERDEAQIERDRAKDCALESAGVDHVRLESQSVYRTNGRERLTTYLANLWFASRAFHEAQDNGQIPYDEIFIPWGMFEFPAAPGDSWCLVPTQQLRAELMLARDETGVPMIPYPQSWAEWNHETARVAVRTMLVLDADLFLAAKTKIGTFRIPGVSPADVAEDLNIFDLTRQLLEWRSREGGRALHRKQLDGWLSERSIGRPQDRLASTAVTGGVYAWIQPSVCDGTWVSIGGRKSA